MDVAPFFTIGHSTRSVDEVVQLLREAGAGMVADVRTMPRSRTNPQFNSDVLAATLAAAAIDYRHFKALGGLRGKAKQTNHPANDLWRNASFRNYADYAQTAAFAKALASLITLGRAEVLAVMCAEAVWWRCHRRIIADYLLAGGEQVFHIMGRGVIVPASPTPGAKFTNGSVTYPAPTAALTADAS
ncbi:MAG TPA: DUF488 domain-containing protein [Caulobacteraceae bacterium]